MPVGPNEKDKVAPTQPSKSNAEQVQIEHHKANPGPAIPKDFSAQQEGTKEERQKRAQELNK